MANVVLLQNDVPHRRVQLVMSEQVRDLLDRHAAVDQVGGQRPAELVRVHVGWTSTRLQKEHQLGSGAIMRIRRGQPDDLIGYQESQD